MAENLTYIELALRTIGWPVIRRTRESSWYEIESTVGDKKVRVTAYGPGFLAPFLPGEGTKLGYLFVDVGGVEGASTRWALLSKKGVDVQVVGAPGWLVVASGFALSSVPYVNEKWKIDTFFELARAVVDADGGSASEAGPWGTWPFQVLDNPLVKRRTLPLKIGGGAMTTASLAGLVTAILYLGEASFVLCYPIGFLGLSGAMSLAAGFQRTAAIYKAHGQAKPAIKALRSSRTFDVRPKVTPQRPIWFYVMGSANDDLALLEAAQQSVLIRSGSRKLDLELRLTLHSTLWPERAADACRLLPPSWCTLELRGPAEHILLVPPRRHEIRTTDTVRWQMGPEELAEGELVSWLLMVDAAFCRPAAGPYR